MRNLWLHLFILGAMILPVAAEEGTDRAANQLTAENILLLPPGMSRSHSSSAAKTSVTPFIPMPGSSNSRLNPKKTPLTSQQPSAGKSGAASSPDTSNPHFQTLVRTMWIPSLKWIWPPLIGILVFVLLAKLLSSPITKGWLGEMMVIHGALKKLDPAIYQQYHDIYLTRPDGRGTTQIDHIVVSKFGIFVIETKNHKGWIFGTEKQAKWTQQIFRSKHRFQNPLHQNYLHVKALMKFLGQPEDRFLSLVIFVGGAEFKTPMPANVLNSGLLPWITGHTAILFNQEAVKNLNFRLDTLSRTTNRKTASREHLIAIKVRNA